MVYCIRYFENVDYQSKQIASIDLLAIVNTMRIELSFIMDDVCVLVERRRKWSVENVRFHNLVCEMYLDQNVIKSAI